MYCIVLTNSIALIVCYDVTFCCSVYSSYYSRQVFNYRDVLHPHTGETVAVRYSADQQWYRGQVMQCVEASVQVNV